MILGQGTSNGKWLCVCLWVLVVPVKPGANMAVGKLHRRSSALPSNRQSGTLGPGLWVPYRAFQKEREFEGKHSSMMIQYM